MSKEIWELVVGTVGGLVALPIGTSIMGGGFLDMFIVDISFLFVTGFAVYFSFTRGEDN